ncbi:MAG: hypothetical protein ABW170_05215 [Candidatus Thiodiazotropha sp. L084R]
MIDFIDLIVNKQCHEYSECHLLQPFIVAGMPILNTEHLALYQNSISVYLFEHSG